MRCNVRTALAKVRPHLNVEIVKRSDRAKGFVVLSKRVSQCRQTVHPDNRGAGIINLVLALPVSSNSINHGGSSNGIKDVVKRLSLISRSLELPAQ